MRECNFCSSQNFSRHEKAEHMVQNKFWIFNECESLSIGKEFVDFIKTINNSVQRLGQQY